MSEYKKKQRKNLKSKNRNTNAGTNYDRIGFNTGRAKQKSQKRKVKPRSATPVLTVAALGVLVLFVYFIITAIHPVGVFEYLKNVHASTGTGSGYNVDIEGGKPSYTLTDQNKFYLVNSSSVNCYNKNGKVIFERAHSFSKPVVCVSDTRYLVYGQGEKELTVNTLSSTLYRHNFKSQIICADVSDSGSFAVATKAEGYASAVTVFNKNNKKIYEWFSTDETVNAVALSPNGKTLAVSTIKVVNGKYISTVHVLKFKSADAVAKKIYSDRVVYSLNAVSNTTFCAAFKDNIEFINYKKDATVSNVSEYSVSIVKQIGNRVIVLRTVAANQDESIIEVYNTSGKKLSSFSTNNYVTDFSYRSGKIYLLGISDIYKYNEKGRLLATGEAVYDALYIEAVSDNSVALIRNATIDSCTLQKTGE
jgi:hypothetical protein